MAKVRLQMTLQSEIRKVWKVITDNSQYAWRSDLERIEVLDSRHFIEYAKNGIETRFTITAKEPCKRYVFSMENRNMTGSWTGLLRETASGTEIDFTEEVKARKLIMNLFAGFYLKKQQKQYAADLKRKLGEE